MKNRNKKLLKASLLLTSLLLVGCGTTDDVNTQKGGNQPSEQSGDVSSPIKSLTAVKDTVEVKIDESFSIDSNLKWEATSGSLTAAKKQCTYESSNPDVIKIVSKLGKAVGLGTCTVTATSKTDNTKKATFTVNVTDVYFDRNQSSLSSGDDTSKELIEDGGVVRTTSMNTVDMYIKNAAATKFSVSVTCQIHSVGASELFPKMGIRLSTADYTTDAQNNGLVFFIDMPMQEYGKWVNYGICEIQNGTNWAWNPGISNATARHLDNLYTSATPLDYNQDVSFTLVRDGLDLHFFVGDNYAGSCHPLESLFTNSGEPAKTIFGFFEFNSDVTFHDYSYTLDSDKVDEKIKSIENVHFLEDSEWAED